MLFKIDNILPLPFYHCKYFESGLDNSLVAVYYGMLEHLDL